MENIQLINERCLAEITGQSLQTLRNNRHKGRGIPYHKIGRSVRYSMGDVKKYISGCKIQTEDCGCSNADKS